MAKDRPPAFQFYVRDYLSSMAVCAMTPEERGGYVHLLCHAWLQDEPGVLPADEAILAGLSGLGARWADCRPGILRAFRGGTRNGAPVHVQPRLMAEREAQASRREKAAKGARATNDARWSSVANESLGGRSSVALQSASATALETEPRVKTLVAPDGATTPKGAPKGKSKPTPPPSQNEVDWLQAFADFLWPDWLSLRKCSKAAALKAWKLVPHPDSQAAFDTLDAALQADKAAWKAEGREPHFIPHAATWINDYRANLEVSS